MTDLYGSGKPYRVVFTPPVPDIRIEIKDLLTSDILLSPTLRQMITDGYLEVKDLVVLVSPLIRRLASPRK